MLVVGIIVGLIILVLLVAVHELGHAIAARRNGVKVEEFGIGFPPRATSKVVARSFLGKNVRFSLNWLPLGGFVKLQGEYDAAAKKGDFGAATFWQKTKILLAGVLMNWIVAAVIFSILAVVGLPKLIDGQFMMPGDTTQQSTPVTLVDIAPNSAAARAGFEKGQTIVSVDGTPIKTATEFVGATSARAGQEVEIVSLRDGQEVAQTLTLGSGGEEGVFGASISQRDYLYSTWSAPIVGVVTTAQLSYETVKGVGVLFGNFVSGLFQSLSPDATTRDVAQEKLGEVSNSVAGPVGILGVLFPAASQQGFESLLLLTGVISLTLAVMNTLPIPALDGGRWFVMAVFRIIRRPLSKAREEAIHGVGLMLLLGLIVLITIADILKVVG